MTFSYPINLCSISKALLTESDDCCRWLSVSDFILVTGFLFSSMYYYYQKIFWRPISKLVRGGDKIDQHNIWLKPVYRGLQLQVHCGRAAALSLARPKCVRVHRRSHRDETMRRRYATEWVCFEPALTRLVTVPPDVLCVLYKIVHSDFGGREVCGRNNNNY